MKNSLIKFICLKNEKSQKYIAKHKYFMGKQPKLIH